MQLVAGEDAGVIKCIVISMSVYFSSKSAGNAIAFSHSR